MRQFILTMLFALFVKAEGPNTRISQAEIVYDFTKEIGISTDPEKPYIPGAKPTRAQFDKFFNDLPEKQFQIIKATIEAKAATKSKEEQCIGCDWLFVFEELHDGKKTMEELVAHLNESPKRWESDRGGNKDDAWAKTYRTWLKEKFALCPDTIDKIKKRRASVVEWIESVPSDILRRFYDRSPELNKGKTNFCEEFLTRLSEDQYLEPDRWLKKYRKTLKEELVDSPYGRFPAHKEKIPDDKKFLDSLTWTEAEFLHHHIQAERSKNPQYCIGCYLGAWGGMKTIKELREKQISAAANKTHANTPGSH